VIDRDIWREVYGALSSNRMRTLLTASGIFWGIFILIVMLGFGNGVEVGVNRSMQGYASNALYLWGRRTSEPWQGLAPGRAIRLDNDDTAAIEAGVDTVAHLAPRARLGRWRGRNDVVHGTKLTDAEVMGDTPALKHILPMNIQIGRFINPLDIAQRRKVAVIGERVHEELFGLEQNPVGKQVQIQQISFTVVGVFKPRHYGKDKERLMSTVFTPLSTFQQVFNRGKRINYFAMVPRAGVSSEQLAADVQTLLAGLHRIAPHDRRAFGNWNSETDYLRIRNLFTGIRGFIWTVGIATLLAGVLGVSNIMLIVIRERRREFAIRKSIGATPAAVVRMILLETSVLVGVAGLAGLVCGLAGLQLIDVFTRGVTENAGSDVLFSAPFVDMRVALAAMLALALAALLATVIPARHATQIDPAEALRSE